MLCHRLKRQVPVLETCWALGVRPAQKHSAILATRKWCLGTAEKLKDVSEISVIFCSRILERQSQPEKIRAPSRKSINCIVSNHFFYIICLSHRHPGSPSLEFMCQCNAWNLSDLDVLGMSWVCLGYAMTRWRFRFLGRHETIRPSVEVW